MKTEESLTINDLSGDLKVRETYEITRTDQLVDVEAGLVGKAKYLLKSLKKSEISGMDPDKKFKALKDTITSFETIYKAGRLEKGESTENVAVIVQAIKEAKKRKLQTVGGHYGKTVKDDVVDVEPIPSR